MAISAPSRAYARAMAASKDIYKLVYLFSSEQSQNVRCSVHRDYLFQSHCQILSPKPPTRTLMFRPLLGMYDAILLFFLSKIANTPCPSTCRCPCRSPRQSLAQDPSFFPGKNGRIFAAFSAYSIPASGRFDQAEG